MPPVFLDTNVFMYAAGVPHRYKQPCLQILADVETGRLIACVNTESFQELLYRYGHIGLAEKGILLCREILIYPLTILSVTDDDARAAIELFDAHRMVGIKPRDAIHAATMKNNGITTILSADQDFDAFSGLSRIDPIGYLSVR